MRIKSEVNPSLVKTPVAGSGYTVEEAVSEAMRCLDCPAQYCRKSCPIHTPVPEMCRHIREKNFETAFEIVYANNSLTAMTCRVCPAEKQCEANCTRGIRGEAVNISALEQFVNDWHAENATSAQVATEPVGSESVAVVGSGPAGLSCAVELLKNGCPVTVYDAAEKPGGIPRWGIPDFVLPPEITESITKQVEDLGATFVAGKRLGGNITIEELQNKHKAVFLGLGAPVPVSGGFDSAMQAQYLLHEASLGRNPVKGCSVAVIGGGDTAIDAVRVARKLGAKDVVLLYRRGKDDMPARQEDVAAAEKEGVRFMWWTEPVEISEEKLVCRRTEPAPPDYPGGRLNARSVPVSEFELPAEIAVLALGFKNTPVGGVPCDKQGRVVADENGCTSVPGVFAGGDAVSGPATVVRAAAAGKRAASAILNYLKAQN